MQVTCPGCDAEVNVHLYTDQDWRGNLIPEIDEVIWGECECEHDDKWHNTIAEAVFSAIENEDPVGEY